ncbi:DHA2 family efflux MFS transporter permease subunit [Cellulomonas massiliensis]|uniref:DHA2 family efflux MFS transporter permease subunit n=1 Tax=Cellulomonas massiliensis TaxID=1465811 RepID=UPI0002E3ED53|nr:DHA2 family efflux MFS transporter permease subunit [Cellulomonas massiliensis]
MTTPTTGEPSPATLTPEHRRAVGVLLVATFVVILNETIMGVALPHLMTDLSITASTAQWLTTAFMLTMAVVIPVTGFVIQRTTTRATFVAAMTLFSLGTLVCALAPGFTVLLAGRIVQATGTAIMLPLLMSTVMTVTPPATRGRTMGNISIVISVAPALGPTISGVILSTLSWQWMFGLVLPIAVTALLVGARLVPNVTEPRVARVDVVSVVLSAIAFGGLVYGLSGIGAIATGTVPTATWVALAAGAIGLAVFVTRQLQLQRTDDALLDLRTFRSPVFTVSVVVMALMMMAMFGVIILLPIFAQDVLGLAPLQTGLLLLPGGLAMGLAAPFVGRAYDRFGPRVLVVPGAAVVSASLWLLTTATASSPAGVLLAAHVLLSLGLALMFTPLFSASLGSLPPHLYSHGSAVVGTVQQVAGAAGTAVFVTVMTAQALALGRTGADATAALAGGIHTAFLVGAALSLVAIPAALAIRAPAASPHDAQQPEQVAVHG